ncbi:uncharacterized protein LOC111381977 [Olea europaea var. sylvestris]|uniref:uncharacterized protein LOC111381977 n=1 Tax=Olea europaea var. sylvestris TaxID=158386 RepID=UPI000C1CE877|nr:uncharacterized protein LOC111381977 [Olea europaea var. sylvestris]
MLVYSLRKIQINNWHLSIYRITFRSRASVSMHGLILSWSTEKERREFKGDVLKNHDDGFHLNNLESDLFTVQKTAYTSSPNCDRVEDLRTFKRKSHESKSTLRD